MEPNDADEVVTQLRQWVLSYYETSSVIYLFSPEWEAFERVKWQEYNVLEARRLAFHTPPLAQEIKMENRRADLLRFKDQYHCPLNETLYDICPLAVRMDQFEAHDSQDRLYSWKSLLQSWTRFQALFDSYNDFQLYLSPSKRASYLLLKEWWESSYCDPYLMALASSEDTRCGLDGPRKLAIRRKGPTAQAQASRQPVHMDRLILHPQDDSPEADIEIARQASIFRGYRGSIAWLNDVGSWDGVRNGLRWLSLKLQENIMRPYNSPTPWYRSVTAADLSAAAQVAQSPSEHSKVHSTEPISWFSSPCTLQEAVLCPDITLCSRDWTKLTDDWDAAISLQSLMVFMHQCERFCITEGPIEKSFASGAGYLGALISHFDRKQSRAKRDSFTAAKQLHELCVLTCQGSSGRSQFGRNLDDLRRWEHLDDEYRLHLLLVQ
ncbi:hypothetical protein PG994_012886 [Apiospora phragmitis]|uniref:Uncharacterized protein n=1 Tax=Apiospora phragmitis TaxID=2905665 RepID=A0ABR1T726_9PEZI